MFKRKKGSGAKKLSLSKQMVLLRKLLSEPNKQSTKALSDANTRISEANSIC